MQAVPNNCADGGSNLFPTNHLEDILLSALFHAKHKRLIPYLENNTAFQISPKTHKLFNCAAKEK